MVSKFSQGMIYQLNDAFGRHTGVIDDMGIIFSYTDHSYIEKNLDEILSSLEKADRYLKYGGFTFAKPQKNSNGDLIVFVEGEDAEAAQYANILSISLSGVKQIHDEHYDKTTLVKNILLDNVLPGDVLMRANELHIEYDSPRTVMLIRSSEAVESSIIEIVQNLFPEKDFDFTIGLDECSVVLVKQISRDATVESLNTLAKSIVDTLCSEAMIDVTIGISSVAPTIKDIASAYREAQIAIEICKVFDTEKNIINYENLGIARLIYQLPTTLCELFLHEVFKKKPLEVLDRETLYTIIKFFENNLNVSETSRQLYVHRNTLVYRLDKVQKLTGLDLRNFEHAITFKVAMMVQKYLDSNPTKF